MTRRSSINLSRLMSELSSFKCLKLYSLNFAIGMRKLKMLCLSLGHTKSRDHRIARVVTNLGDVRPVATTKDQSLGFIHGLPLMLFGKMHSMIGCDNIRTVM